VAKKSAKKRASVPALKGNLEASAKFSATASYQRKKITTEVIPPDVSRAKAGAWLALISPITEWAGLKADPLRYQRAQLRIQQEDALMRLAVEVRKKMEGHAVIQPVPPKILVPALEKASLENPDDSFMIDRWANLLASAAQSIAIQPRYIGILGELAGSQARCLETLAFTHWENTPTPYGDFAFSYFSFSEQAVEHFVRLEFRDTPSMKRLFDPAASRSSKLFCARGFI
jgi:Abortive infection alpha